MRASEGSARKKGKILTLGHREEGQRVETGTTGEGPRGERVDRADRNCSEVGKAANCQGPRSQSSIQMMQTLGCGRMEPPKSQKIMFFVLCPQVIFSIEDRKSSFRILVAL